MRMKIVVSSAADSPLHHPLSVSRSEFSLSLIHLGETKGKPVMSEPWQNYTSSTSPARKLLLLSHSCLPVLLFLSYWGPTQSFFLIICFIICPVFGRLAAAGERRHDMPGISVPSGTLLHFCKVANSAPAGKSQVLTPGPAAAPDLMYSFEGRGVGEYLGSSSGNSTI